MLFSDLQGLFERVEAELICRRTELIRPGSAVRVRREHGVNAHITVNGVQRAAKFATRGWAEDWAEIQDEDYLAQVEDVQGDRVTVTAVTGFLIRYFDKPLKLAVTDAALDRGRTPFEKVKQHIEGDYVLSHGGKSYIVAAQHRKGKGKSVLFVNGRLAYAAAERSRRECGAAEGAGASDSILALTRGEAPFRRADCTLELWACGLRACDASSAGQISQEVKAHIDNGLARYLELWRRYTEVEYAFIQDTGGQAGTLQYAVEERSGSRAQIRILNPEYQDNFLEKLNELGTDRMVALPGAGVSRRGRPTSFVVSGRLVPGQEKGQAEIQFQNEGKCFAVRPEGAMEPDLHAAKMQYDRRESAFQRIFQGRSAKPQLAMLIAGQDAGRRKEKRGLLPLSETVIRTCFPSHKPTESQRAAIAAALNTPDFAIIQGPPGTGKTTVINAIMMALSEKEKDPDLFYGKNLLTAYQKDATAHLAEKLEIYGLPVMTYMSRLGEGGGAGRENDQAVLGWIQRKRASLREADVQATEYAELDALAARLRLLLVGFDPETASRELCRSLLLACREELLPFQDGKGGAGGTRLAEAYLPRTEDLLARAEAEIQGDSRERARMRVDREAAGNLPISPVSMEDGGEALVERVRRRFSRETYPAEVRKVCGLLTEAYGGEPVNWKRVRTLKNWLLSELGERSGLLSNNRLNGEAEALLDSAVRFIEEAERSDEERIMSSYVGAFADEEGMKKSLEQFITVISATHQKAVSQEVQERKGAEGLEDVVFENVLIDEAARSCPPDLLIPLSCAKERMILVGDHCQLPQFVSDKVFDALDKVEAAEKESVIKGSMFLHLIEQVRKLEAADGICRFVRLDEQFRMPKTLGDLVSECFYEGKLNSPRGNEGFGTDLKYIRNQHLLWLDVPGRAGEREVRSRNGSYERPAEAKRIVKMLRSVIEDSGEAAGKYKYGVMAFYRGQTELIERLIHADRFLRERREAGIRIDVGTVDAFQGMEYDVVFLSVVRSNTDYSSQKKRYGFTTDEHRLCVALSRAMRCMVVAGDSGMMRGRAAREAVPALVKFYEMCAGKEVPDAGVFKDKDFLYEARPEERAGGDASGAD